MPLRSQDVKGLPGGHAAHVLSRALQLCSQRMLHAALAFQGFCVCLRTCALHEVRCHVDVADAHPGALQVHLRHLVGGRARSYMGELPHERIFQARASFPLAVPNAKPPNHCHKYRLELCLVFSLGFKIGLLYVTGTILPMYASRKYLCRLTSLSAPAP